MITVYDSSGNPFPAAQPLVVTLPAADKVDSESGQSVGDRHNRCEPILDFGQSANGNTPSSPERHLQNSPRTGKAGHATSTNPLFALVGRRFRLPQPLAAKLCKYLWQAARRLATAALRAT